jgi:hypothetical protein
MVLGTNATMRKNVGSSRKSREVSMQANPSWRK